MKKVPLLAWIVLAIIAGILIGSLTPGIISGLNEALGWSVPTDLIVQLFVSFSTIFSAVLSFAIPLIILGFIIPGIGSLAQGAGRLLGITVGLSYISSITAGFLALTTAYFLYPVLLKGQQLSSVANPEEALSAGYVKFELTPLMDVTAALVLAFIIGLGITTLKTKNMLHFFEDFQTIIEKLLSYVIIPLLPIHIVGIFANMTLAGEVATIISVFGKVFIMVLLLHWIMLIIQYTVAGSLTGRNPFKALKTMLPAYFTALGTQSSAATIPVTMGAVRKTSVSERIANFVVPLCATIHLSGSMITITSCSVAVVFMTSGHISFIELIPLVLLLAVMMVAAPGVPGGGVMAAIGLLQSMLGFDQSMVALMIALYMAQDSFGTATNVTGDATIAMIVDKISRRFKSSNNEQPTAELENQQHGSVQA
ncbi:dicarboxylate/amino acid:cation symporter [Rothia sp. LK2588]|uniref:dicarboxylate/amino acid:cation symporter n=1 Tax=Rothia sp. LK2588 TaxID=3114369 RepID=UPI0034CD16B3